jgi:hypothetical protein
MDFVYKYWIARESNAISSDLHQGIAPFGYEFLQRDQSLPCERQFSVWWTAIPQGSRAVIFPSRMIWMINWMDGSLSAGLQSAD